VVGRALVAQPHVRLRADALLKRRDYPRLADSGFAGEQYHLAIAGAGTLPAPFEDVDLLLAPDARRQRARVRRFKAALDPARRVDLPGSDRRIEPLEHLRAETGALEQATGKRVCGLGDGDRVRRRNRLQASRQVRRLTGDHRLLCGALTDDVADHHAAGGDSDPHGERRALACGQRPHRVGYAEAGIDRPLGVVLVRPRPAEIDQHAVAHELCDETIEARDHAGAGALVGADQIAVVLGVEPCRQCRRADQIAEHYGKLPALGFGRLEFCLARRSRGRLS
jgi:hypothetical protein